MNKYNRIDSVPVPLEYEKAKHPLRVTALSPIKLRQTVEQFARYFRREFHYDFVQFSTRDKDDYNAYLFAANFNPEWIGAVCFRRREWEKGRRWFLQWVWLHPYYRNRGLLSAAWSKFRAKHGKFIVEPPFSPAMEAFLKRQGRCNICWRASKSIVCAPCKAIIRGENEKAVEKEKLDTRGLLG